MVDALGEKLAFLEKEKQDMNQSLSVQGGTPARVQQFSGDLTLELSTVGFLKRVWSSTSFLLGHSSQGVLGTSKLGGSATSSSNVRVLNVNDTFVMDFSLSRFISGDSTGTVDLSAGTYSLAAGEVLVSEVVAANDEVYGKATLSVSATVSSDLSGFVSFDGGSSWQAASFGVELEGSGGSVDGLAFKLVHSSVASTSVVSSVSLKYSK